MGNRSSFPEQIDSFVELYDLPASLAAKAQRYQELKIKASLTANEQEELNQLSNELNNYIISPETWNKMADCIVNVETFFKDNVDGYIQQKQGEWATYVKDFHYVGVYSDSEAYKFQNMVKYNGDLYLCIKDTTAGIDPTNEDYWVKISTKGDKGDVGLNAYYKGNYNPNAIYNIGDAVSYDGYVYYCTQPSTTGIAPTDGTHWYLWDRTIVSQTRPNTEQKGLIWIQIE